MTRMTGAFLGRTTTQRFVIQVQFSLDNWGKNQLISDEIGLENGMGWDVCDVKRSSCA